MTTKTELRGRGRPRQFDSDQVLDRLVELFWEQGYEATSMSDIVATSGLNKSSIYNSFGSKQELFGQAVDRYLATRAAMLHEVLRDGTSGLDDLAAFLGFVQQEVTGPTGSRGCLAVNTTTELGHCDAAMASMSARYRDDLRTSLRAALDRAAAAGEIDGRRVGQYAESLLSFMLALSVIARGGAERPELDRQFASIRDTIDTWRIDR